MGHTQPGPEHQAPAHPHLSEAAIQRHSRRASSCSSQALLLALFVRRQFLWQWHHDSPGQLAAVLLHAVNQHGAQQAG